MAHFLLQRQRWLASADGKLRLMQPLSCWRQAAGGQASWCSHTGRVQLTCCPRSEWGGGIPLFIISCVGVPSAFV